MEVKRVNATEVQITDNVTLNIISTKVLLKISHTDMCWHQVQTLVYNNITKQTILNFQYQESQHFMYRRVTCLKKHCFMSMSQYVDE